MRKLSYILSLSIFLFLISCTPKVQPPVVEKPVVPAIPQMLTLEDSISYIMGMNMAQQVKQYDGIKKDFFDQGWDDTQTDNNKITEEEIRIVSTRFQMKMQKEAEEKHKMEMEANKTKETAFLASNKNKPGVITTASGLQYKVIKEGAGKKPTATNTVKVHYHGQLMDGTVFDSSIDRGQPIDFQVNGVIKGWVEGLQLMSVGSTYQFYIPSELAYGDRATGKISAGSLLIFDVELIEIVEN